MSLSQILTDLFKLIGDCQPLPDPRDRAAVKAFAVKLAPDIIDLVYDAGGLDAVAAALDGLTVEDARAVMGPAGLKWDAALIAKLLAALPAVIAAIKAIIEAFRPTPPPPPAPPPNNGPVS